MKTNTERFQEEKRKIEHLLEDLASLESYAKDLLNFFPIPICVVSSIGIILEANPALEEISGYQMEELIGKGIEELFKSKDIDEITKEIFGKGSVRGKEATLLTKEKKEIPVNVYARLRKTEEGETIGYFLGFFDLTEIKKFQEQLQTKINELERLREKELILKIRESAKTADIEKKVKELENARKALMNILEDVEEARKKAEEERNQTLAIINNFADGILVFDKEGNLSLINPQAEAFFDVKGRDIIGRSVGELETFPTIRPVAKLLGKEIKKLSRQEAELNENLILEITTIPIVRDKKILGKMVILHDITRGKAIEKMKTEFVSIAAHQLRTPLSAIKWTLKMILDGDLGSLTKEQREFLEKTYQSNERIINLINDLLNVTRIEEGRYIYKPQTTEILPIIESLLKSYEGMIQKKNLTLELKKPPKLPKVKVDIEKISLAIQNLLENAIIYNVPNGKIEITLEDKGEEIQISVKDTGIGIPKDQQQRMFTKFFRGSNAMKIDTEGSGLGLFITKNIIDAHGGKIWFESEEGKGTTFYFTLPTVGKFEEISEFFKMKI